MSCCNWSQIFISLPTDGANINKSINVCACESLASHIKSHPYNTDGSCVTRSPPDSDTLDLTNCEPSVTEGCVDGIQDLYYVRMFLFKYNFLIVSLKCQGAATTLSYPHFYLAEDQTKYFNGLNPDPEKHRLFLNVEPHTGMTLKLHSRIQVLLPSSEALILLVV